VIRVKLEIKLEIVVKLKAAISVPIDLKPRFYWGIWSAVRGWWELTEGSLIPPHHNGERSPTPPVTIENPRMGIMDSFKIGQITQNPRGKYIRYIGGMTC
jgi:hypothetical protein